MSTGGRRKRRRTTTRRQRGGDLRSALGKVNSFLKEHKIISRGANALAGLLPGTYGAIAGRVGSTAASLGYGRRKRPIRRRR